MKIRLLSQANETHFHMKVSAPDLALKKRLKTTREKNGLFYSCFRKVQTNWSTHKLCILYHRSSLEGTKGIGDHWLLICRAYLTSRFKTLISVG